MALIAGGGICLTWIGSPKAGVPYGSLAIASACFAWAVDNNLTRKVSAGDPVEIAILKGLTAGSVSTTLGLAMGAKLPSLPVVVAVGVIGLVGYGLSLILFILALRNLGTARTGAYFSIAPFVGATLSILFLNDRLTLGFGIATILMAAGVWLHITERHEHEHRHESTEHDHLHAHDKHHQHSHAANNPPGERHTHSHRHEELPHSHPHYPDFHHRHRH